MMGAFALAASLMFAPAQTTTGINISNIRHTYRDLGATRPDTNYLPGDVIFIAFDIEGLKMNDEGKVSYVMGLEVLDKAGKAIFNAPPTKNEMILPLGGAKLPGHVYVAAGPEMQTGTYKCKITISDATGGIARIAEQSFTILPLNLGMVG